VRTRLRKQRRWVGGWMGGAAAGLGTTCVWAGESSLLGRLEAITCRVGSQQWRSRSSDAARMASVSRTPGGERLGRPGGQVSRWVKKKKGGGKGRAHADALVQHPLEPDETEGQVNGAATLVLTGVLDEEDGTLLLKEEAVKQGAKLKVRLSVPLPCSACSRSRVGAQWGCTG
jgi:hypothetical protein